MKRLMGVFFCCLAITALAGITVQNVSAGDYPKEITIGALLPLSGPASQFGEKMRTGAQLAIDELNAKGGVNGKIKIKAVYEDNQGQANVAVIAMNKLVDLNKVPFTLSSYTGVTLAIAPIADKAKVTVINGGGQGNELAGCSPYVFNDIPVVGSEIKVIAKYAADNLGKASAVLATTDETGLSYGKTWREIFTNLGGKIVAYETVPYGSTDYRSRLSKIKVAKPELIYLAGLHGRDSLIAYQQMKEIDLQAIRVGTSVTVAAGVMADPSAVGVYHTQLSWDPKGDFVTNYKSKYGKDPDFYVSNYYNAILILAEAVKHIMAQDWPLDGESIRKAISSIRTFDGVNGKIIFGLDNVAQTDMDVCIIETGGKDKILQRVKAQ